MKFKVNLSEPADALMDDITLQVLQSARENVLDDMARIECEWMDPWPDHDLWHREMPEYIRKDYDADAKLVPALEKVIAYFSVPLPDWITDLDEAPNWRSEIFPEASQNIVNALAEDCISPEMQNFWDSEIDPVVDLLERINEKLDRLL
jgi:hypothetical protein